MQHMKTCKCFKILWLKKFYIALAHIQVINLQQFKCTLCNCFNLLLMNCKTFTYLRIISGYLLVISANRKAMGSYPSN